jgi:alpha-ribazole phosphatase
MPKPVVADLLRHGDTGCRGFRGTLDDALTPLGWQQMEQAVADAAWDALISSPRQRCAAFARELGQRLSIPIQLDERLAELHFGEWEGKTAEQLLQQEPDALQKFWQDPERHTPPGGESLSAFSARVLQAWRELQQHHAGQRVLVITHGGVIRRLLCHARGLPPNRLLTLEVPHGSLHRLEHHVPEPA